MQLPLTGEHVELLADMFAKGGWKTYVKVDQRSLTRPERLKLQALMCQGAHIQWAFFPPRREQMPAWEQLNQGFCEVKPFADLDLAQDMSGVLLPGGLYALMSGLSASKAPVERVAFGRMWSLELIDQLRDSAFPAELDLSKTVLSRLEKSVWADRPLDDDVADRLTRKLTKLKPGHTLRTLRIDTSAMTSQAVEKLRAACLVAKVNFQGTTPSGGAGKSVAEQVRRCEQLNRGIGGGIQFDRDVDFAAGESAYLSATGMGWLADGLNYNKLWSCQRVALGRVSSFEPLMKLHGSSLPPELDLSQTREYDPTKGIEQRLTDEHAQNLARQIWEVRRSMATLKLRTLRIDATAMSDKAVSELSAACEQNNVKLEWVRNL
jgi:hypothetical protein